MVDGEAVEFLAGGAAEAALCPLAVFDEEVLVISDGYLDRMQIALRGQERDAGRGFFNDNRLEPPEFDALPGGEPEGWNGP